MARGKMAKAAMPTGPMGTSRRMNGQMINGHVNLRVAGAVGATTKDPFTPMPKFLPVRGNAPRPQSPA